MNTVVVTQYKPLEYLPPVMSLLVTLKQIGRTVIFVGVHSEQGEAFLTSRGIEHQFMPGYDRRLYTSRSIADKIFNRVKRAWAFGGHRRWMRAKLMELEKAHGELVLWHSEVLSAALVGNWGERFKKRLLTIYELADFTGRYWLGFSLRRLLKKVNIVVPEYNRAHILKEYFHLPALPFVLPNKPIEYPKTKNLPLPNDECRVVFEKIGNKPVFLYQGVWNEDRQDVVTLLETIARNRPDYCVVSMPNCEAVREMSKRYSNVYGVPYVAPPHHLAVTSHASVGVAVYNAAGKGLLNRLGAVYCAPNKIYEYAGFGIPTLGNNLPGLKYTVEAADAGKCCEMNEESILAAADDLVSRLPEMSDSALKFYNRTDLASLVTQILTEIEQHDV